MSVNSWTKHDLSQGQEHEQDQGHELHIKLIHAYLPTNVGPLFFVV